MSPQHMSQLISSRAELGPRWLAWRPGLQSLHFTINGEKKVFQEELHFLKRNRNKRTQDLAFSVPGKRPAAPPPPGQGSASCT